MRFFKLSNAILLSALLLETLIGWTQDVIKSHNNGNPHIIGQKVKSQKQGKWIELNPKGDTVAIVHFKDDKLEGDFMFTIGSFELNPNEILIKEDEEYSQLLETDYKATGTIENSLLQGEYFVYTYSGSIGSVTIYKDGKANGLRKSYFKTGEISFEENYENDQLQGKWVAYFNTGKIKEERTYEKGIHSTSINYEWSSDGILKKKIAYIFIPLEQNKIDKVNHGKWTQYYENGDILSESYYDMGDPNGTWIGYYESGNIKYKMIYENKIYKSYEKFEDK